MKTKIIQWHRDEVNDKVNDFIKVNNWHNDGITVYDKATDGMHPGQESNNAVAEKMYRILND